MRALPFEFDNGFFFVRIRIRSRSKLSGRRQTSGYVMCVNVGGGGGGGVEIPHHLFISLDGCALFSFLFFFFLIRFSLPSSFLLFIVILSVLYLLCRSHCYRYNLSVWPFNPRLNLNPVGSGRSGSSRNGLKFGFTDSLVHSG